MSERAFILHSGEYSTTHTERQAAARTVASHAHDADEARLFLDMIGVTADGQAVA